MTINDTWGYARNDQNWKSAEDLIRKLCDIASKGGNFLLNVGPTALGEFPEEIKARLARIGAWIAANGEAIYGTTQSPFLKLPFEGRCTVKDNRIYLHIFRWPEDGLRLCGLRTPVLGARVLGSGEQLKVTVPITPEAPTLYISRPKKLDPIATVVAVRLAGPPSIEGF